jgi:hypothetical protein
MRGPLSGVRARIDRLSARLGQESEGCYACLEYEQQVRFSWQDVLVGPDSGKADMVEKQPKSATCGVCGRTYALQYTVLRWQS